MGGVAGFLGPEAWTLRLLAARLMIDAGISRTLASSSNNPMSSQNDTVYQ